MEKGTTKPPVSQKQEDLLIELFSQLTTEDRKKVIRLCRDLIKAYESTQNEGGKARED